MDIGPDGVDCDVAVLEPSAGIAVASGDDGSPLTICLIPLRFKPAA